MTIKIDFDALIKVMLDELERQYPNEVTQALQGTKTIFGESIKNNPKAWFSSLCAGIVLIDGQSLD